jgi:hypothetical protein
MKNALLEEWCLAAIVFLEASGLPPKFAEMRRSTVRAHAAKPKQLLEIAANLSEDIADVSEEVAQLSDDASIERYGFGISHFLDAKVRRVMGALVENRIRNERQHRDILDMLADTTLEPGMRSKLETLMAAHIWGELEN